MNKQLQKAYRFFYENDGHATPPGRAVCAMQSARADLLREKLETAGRVEFQWLPDEMADGPEQWGWPEKDVKRFYESDHFVEGCRLFVDGEEKESLWGIFDADATYRRIIETQLFSNYLANPSGEMVQIAPSCYGPRQLELPGMLVA